MPRVKKEEKPIKKETSKKITPSLRATAKQSQKQIATDSSSPRNDEKKIVRRTTGLSVPVYSLAGRTAGTMSLPKEIFGREVNKNLLAQAVRVYATNRQVHPGSTKTRGQVRGSTAKIYRQKGTGRARHGAITAPIFVGGGIVFGPKPRKTKLELPKKMRKVALYSALSAKAAEKEILGLAGLEKASGKTKEMAGLMSLVKKQKNVSALIITGEKQDNIVRGVRNIPGVDVLPANLINAYEVLRHQLLLVTKESIDIILGSTERSRSTTPESKKTDSGQVPTESGSRQVGARMTNKRSMK